MLSIGGLNKKNSQNNCYHINCVSSNYTYHRSNFPFIQR